MALSRARLFRAAAPRSDCLTLDHIGSIGLQSGELGGRQRTVAPVAHLNLQPFLKFPSRRIRATLYETTQLAHLAIVELGLAARVLG